VITVEAGNSLLLERDQIVDLAERAKISIIARFVLTLAGD
jgi:DUF1009 family protein